MKLIGLSGTNGSGKDTVGQILAEHYNFLFVSMTDMLREEARARNVDTTREVLRTISAEWRRESGLGVLVDRSIAYYEKMGGDQKYTGLVIASLRNPGENDRVHELGGEVVWIDADPKIRYERLKSRMRADDPQTYEEFLKNDESEMHRSGDETTLSMADVKEKADKIFLNEQNDIESLRRRIEDELMLARG
jgi:dephospho-CoA kinase